jgi:SAM-dependent methyltransferase
MRRISHWTPRYVMNRVSWWAYQRNHPDQPWLNPDAVRLLERLLLPNDQGLEWGSGRSTAWFAGRVKHLTSVEHNPQWHQIVSEQLRAAGRTNVTYKLLPAPQEGREAESEYVRAYESFAAGSLGFVLVDGVARDFCVAGVLDRIAPGGVLVIDDAHRYFDHQTYSPLSRNGRGPANERWGQVARTLSGWRHMWTSQGISDTAIWIRPAIAAAPGA